MKTIFAIGAIVIAFMFLIGLVGAGSPRLSYGQFFGAMFQLIVGYIILVAILHPF